MTTECAWMAATISSARLLMGSSGGNSRRNRKGWRLRESDTDERLSAEAGSLSAVALAKADGDPSDSRWIASSLRFSQ
jgi:hypothetical protein